MTTITTVVGALAPTANSHITTAETFPIVDKMGELARGTATTLGATLVIAIGIVIAIGLIWSHLGDRETGKWWKALLVWVIGAAIIAGIVGLQAWVATNITV